MSQTDIFNLEEQINLVKNEGNKDDLGILLEEFKRDHFPNVLSKSKSFREKYSEEKELVKTLLIIESVCHAQIGEYKAASDIIKTLYQEPENMTTNELVMLGELAFMSDFKLTRRIITDAVQRMEQEDEVDRIKLARGYLVLGEAEENLEKWKRSIKYYKQGLTYFERDDIRDKHMILFLHFKIGMLYSTIDEADEAIHYLDKSIELAEDYNPEMKINSLVSIAKTYGSKDENEKAFPYLQEALRLLTGSSLAETMVHADAFTEMAFYYFDQSKLDDAVPLYEDAIAIYRKLPNMSARKLGMIYMQYAYCLEHRKEANVHFAGMNYEKAIEQLEKTPDNELLENALADVIAFFDNANNTKKKRMYENQLLKMADAQ